MGESLRFEIRLEADYHIGAGHGESLVDSVLLRDADGVPVLRGSVVVGLLRDATQRLLKTKPFGWARRCRASGLPDAPATCAADVEPCPVCRLFGTPSRPKRWSFDSARPVDALVPRHGARGQAAEEHIVRRVRISPRTRRAVPRKLFSQEHGDRRLVFGFMARTVDAGDAILDEAALIVAAARLVRGLGRGRRRGQGTCRIHLADREAEARWLERFRVRWLHGRPAIGRRVPSEAGGALRCSAADGARVRVRVYARADEPVILAERAEAGNEFQSRDVIPGTAVLGAMAARVASDRDLGESAAKAAFVELLLRGRLRFLSLVPAVYDNGSLIPTIAAPLDLLTCKTFRGFDRDRSEHGVSAYSLVDSVPPRCPACEAQGGVSPLQPLDGFITVYGKRQVVQPARSHEMHVAIDPDSGRVGEGALYGYVSLAVGQFFIGEIVGRDAAAIEALWQAAALPSAGEPFTLRVGKATRRGHGRLTVVLERLSIDARDPWRGLPLEERVPGRHAPGDLVMTLLTDAVVPDSWLRGRLGIDSAWLSELVGADVAVVKAFARNRIIDGFFGHLGLPRFRDVALAAGSAVGFRFDGAPPRDLHERLARLEQAGVGLRRAEGFGEVVFNHPVYDVPERLDENRLPVPQALAPSADRETPAEVVAAFRLHWAQEIIGKLAPDARAGTGFQALARLVRQGAGGTIAALRGRLNSFGQRDGAEAAGGRRSTKAVARDTAACRKALDHLLEDLEDDSFLRAHPGFVVQLTAVGLEMLASRVAEAPVDSGAPARGESIGTTLEGSR